MRGTHYLKSWSSTQKNVKWRGARDAAVDVVSRSPMTASIMVGLVCSTGSSGQEGETANCVMSEWDIFGCNRSPPTGA